ncbi:MAG: cupredoxin domain-containing protein [bacterium]|nr:cupredoxin domain-containing protein [bacterium]
MKTTIISIIAAVVLIGGAFMLTKGNSQSQSDTQVAANNVTVVDGKQVITINAKGGYQPRKSIAQAGIPTVIRFDTNGTFDCSSTVRIPSMNISKTLPQTGSTDVDVGTQQVATLQGTCGMGMYPFEIEFTS